MLLLLPLLLLLLLLPLLLLLRLAAARVATCYRCRCCLAGLLLASKRAGRRPETGPHTAGIKPLGAARGRWYVFSDWCGRKEVNQSYVG